MSHDSRSQTTVPNQPVRVRPFAMADRGMAMGHVEGVVAFVPFAAPGDLVEVEVVRRKRRYLETRLLRILEPSPCRREAPCPVFSVCGGCQWQHLPYAEQLNGKAASFKGFMRSRVGVKDVRRFHPPIPSPLEWGYRNRVGLKVRSLAGIPTLGLFATGSHRLVPVEHCPVAHPRINTLLPPLAGFLRTWPPAAGALPQVDLQVDDAGYVWCTLHLLRPLTPTERVAAERFLLDHGVAAARVQSGRKHTLTPLWPDGPERMSFQVHAGEAELPLQVSAGGFVQANTGVNQRLVDEVVGLSGLYRDGTALDLYCGAGNFTLPLAQAAGRVVAAEGYPPAARDAEGNAARLGCDHVTVLNQPVADALRHLGRESLRPDFALLDPPRDGAADAVDALAAIQPRHILYISCAPPTLARDVKRLCTHGYRVSWTRIADMFPQTAHVESLTLLVRE